MSVATISAAVIALSLAALVTFVGVAITEFTYAAEHPHAYGPARVIAWGGVGGALVSAAVSLLGILRMRDR